MNRLILTIALAAGALPALADNETMYLVKDDHVVSKYAAGQVDYITFNLPEGVSDENIWLTVDKVGKNTVTYTVNTSGSNIAYAHNLISYYDANYMSLDLFGQSLDELDAENLTGVLQYTLSYDAFVGVGKRTFTQNDFQQYDNSSEAYRFKVTPGTKYYLCAWQVDPQTAEPLEDFTFTELTTLEPEQVDLNLDVTFVKYNDHGMVLDFTGFPNIFYVSTCWGMKTQMQAYEEYYGRDFLMGTFAQNWSMDFLAGTGDLEPGVENATWPVYDPGEYIMYVNAYDPEGNVEQKTFTFSYETPAGEEENPVITVLSKEKSEGSVAVSFEITPSNVEEAVVRLMPENDVENRLNQGYSYAEIANGGTSIDITHQINTTGEYSFTEAELSEQWYALLIYAKTKTGGQTTLRINFYPDNDSDWSIYKPFHSPGVKKPARIKRAGVPVIKK